VIDTVVFERDRKVYLVGAVAPISPSSTEVEEYAFAGPLRSQAPNENIVWMRGQYVEADKPNLNGAEWASEELAIKALTPMLMPVTVMHDPSTAVGLIADTKLLTREGAGVPRSRIDTTLGLWAHRFPEVVEEAMHNYRNGALMQSMECMYSHYDCAACGASFPNLPERAERVNWCAHLKASANERAARRLRDITFTGTGLIFGSRGAKGAYSEAHLEVFQEEVAEFHERAHSAGRGKRKRRARNMDTIEIDRSEYDSLKAAAARVPELEAKAAGAETEAAKVPELERKVEQAETEKVAAETRATSAEAKVSEHEEAARTATLASERLGKLGGGFTAKLGEFTKSRLSAQAGALSDEDWDARLQELEETAGVKRDDGGTASDDADVLSREEIARSATGGAIASTAPSPQARGAVIGGLLKQLTKTE
jgi:hypothetical protein